MIYSPTRYLEVTQSRMSPELVSPTALARLKTISAILPPVSNLLLECRLGASGSVDLAPQFLAYDGSRTFLTNKNPNYILPNQGVLDSHVWRRVQDFCMQWEEVELLNMQVADIWLEFDVDGPPPRIPIPGLFVTYEKKPGATDWQVLRSKHHQATKLALEILLAAPLPPLLAHKIDACFGLLPKHSYMFSVGIMLSRDSLPIKLCVADITPEQVVPYLKDVGWPGCYDTVHTFLHEIEPFLDRIAFQLDVINGEISPKIGFECYLTEHNPRKEARWHLLLDYLVKMGQCTPDKREALLMWYGGQYNVLSQELEGNFVDAPCSRNVLVRCINHIKVVIHPDSSYETKAYLCINKSWLPPAKSTPQGV